MLILLFIVGLILALIGFHFLRSFSTEAIGSISACLGMFFLVAATVGLVITTIDLVSGKVIADKIEMYEEENLKVESQISKIVDQYMEYEKDTYSKITRDTEDAIAIIQFYPELKSNTLATSLIETYKENNLKIKELKLEEINLSVLRWWIYFGK